jgi:anti-anti-sigma regulatory factor
VSDEAESMTMRLEGRVTGPWVRECDKAYRSIASSLESKKLRVDLRGVTHMDASGKELLREIRQRSGAEFIADTPMTKYFAQQALGLRQHNSKREA